MIATGRQIVSVRLRSLPGKLINATTTTPTINARRTITTPAHPAPAIHTALRPDDAPAGSERVSGSTRTGMGPTGQERHHVM
jgi:hypothetical protein